LNSALLTLRLRPLQARGEHNPRHYDMYVWQMPIPAFNANDQRHARLAQLAADAEKIVAALVLDGSKRFETLRRLVREAIAASEAGRAIEDEVAMLLAT
jgi:hypothetical protein